MDKKPCISQDVEVRKGPWTMEEDFILINYIANHGEGCVWNSLARSAGLKRTGKSCRLRWLNYLRPDVRRGNITPEEQLLIMELHAKWGNRWSKIAKHLPGRTDNEIKNFWRTRIQKHMKQADQSSDFNINQELQNNININDKYQASSSSNNQINSSSFSPADHTIESYSPVVPGPGPGPFNNGNMETTSFQAAGSHIPIESNENYWSMEDLWSMQFNGD